MQITTENESVTQENELYDNEFVGHGMGWNFVFYRQAFEPFVNTLTTKYLLEHREPGEDSFGVPLGVFVFGLLLNHVSRKQKLKFLRNPDDFPGQSILSSLACRQRQYCCNNFLLLLWFLDDKVIDATGGRRLLMGGCFAYIRHPETAAELLVLASWSLMCGEYSNHYRFFMFSLVSIYPPEITLHDMRMKILFSFDENNSDVFFNSKIFKQSN